MPKFAANLDFLFTELPVLDRPAAAAKAGFPAAEIPFVETLDRDAFTAAKEAAGLDFTVFNIPAGDLRSGGPGLAAMPGREAEFRAAVAVGVDYAKALKPVNVNVLAGWPPAELGRDRCLKVLTENCRIAADAFGEIGVMVTIEPINTRDRPGFLLRTTDETMDILAAANHPNLSIEYDIYHMQIMEGDLIPTIERLLPHIGHIQFADTPGRNEPGTGEINIPAVLEAIDRLGYDRWVGAEYVPTGKTVDSLGWMTRWRE